MIKSSRQAAVLLRADHELVDDVLYLELGGFCLGIRSNSAAFIRKLAKYFEHVVVDAGTADVVVEALSLIHI